MEQYLSQKRAEFFRKSKEEQNCELKIALEWCKREDLLNKLILERDRKKPAMVEATALLAYWADQKKGRIPESFYNSINSSIVIWMSNSTGSLPFLPVERFHLRLDPFPKVEDLVGEKMSRWDLEKLMKKAGMQSFPESIAECRRNGDDLAAESLEKQERLILDLIRSVQDVEEGELPEYEKKDLEWILSQYLSYRAEDEALSER